jgi:hypothetical protein
MRRAAQTSTVVFGLVLVLCVGGLAGYDYYSVSTSNLQPNTSLSTPPLSCAGGQYVALPSSSAAGEKPVLLLQPGTSTRVCVTYQANWTLMGNYTFFKDAYFSTGLLTLTAQITNDVRIENCTCTTYVISHSFSITVQPGSIYPTANMTQIAILYTITPLSNATGFYDHLSAAPGILLAVGYSASQISSPDFPLANIPRTGGPPQPYVPISVTVTGANIGYVTFPEASSP